MSVDRPGQYPFQIIKGDDVRKALNFTFPVGGPTDISAWDAELVAVDCADGTTEVLNLTTGNGGIVMATLSATVIIDDVVTAAITWDEAKYTLKLIDTPGTGDKCTYVTGVICALEV